MLDTATTIVGLSGGAWATAMWLAAQKKKTPDPFHHRGNGYAGFLASCAHPPGILGECTNTLLKPVLPQCGNTTASVQNGWGLPFSPVERV